MGTYRSRKDVRVRAQPLLPWEDTPSMRKLIRELKEHVAQLVLAKDESEQKHIANKIVKHIINSQGDSIEDFFSFNLEMFAEMGEESYLIKLKISPITSFIEIRIISPVTSSIEILHIEHKVYCFTCRRETIKRMLSELKKETLNIDEIKELMQKVNEPEDYIDFLGPVREFHIVDDGHYPCYIYAFLDPVALEVHFIRFILETKEITYLFSARIVPLNYGEAVLAYKDTILKKVKFSSSVMKALMQNREFRMIYAMTRV